MKQLILLLIAGLLSQAPARSAEPAPKSLKEVPLDLKRLESSQTHRYKWVSVVQNGTKRESKDYATLVTISKSENGNLKLHDTITLTRANGGMVFDRTLSFPATNLFAPRAVTIDVTGKGQTVRQLDYTNGEARFVEFSGDTNTEQWVFGGGILTFNALLRVAPLLPRDVGDVYTFAAYAEPFLFRTHEPQNKGDTFTIACEAAETVTIDKKSYECVRFRLDLKSAKVRTDLWVAKSGLVVKFLDTMPEGAEANYLEASLQQ
jgi:hypothetical protein